MFWEFRVVRNYFVGIRVKMFYLSWVLKDGLVLLGKGGGKKKLIGRKFFLVKVRRYEKEFFVWVRLER